RLQSLIKILREEKLSDVQAEEALLTVADSSFVERINRIAVAWLVANNVLEAEAELIIGRLKHKLLGHLIVVVSKNAATLVQLQKFLKLGSVEYQINDDINFYKEKYRASLIKKLGKPLLIESFSLKDIYIPPTGLPVKRNHQPVDLMKWVVSQLDDLDTITVIESESGYGKTSFCQILAARIAHKLYPEWMPVNISLSNVLCGENFMETLESAFVDNPEVNLSAWLKDKTNKTKLLLILDGLNELPNCAENKRAIAEFSRQLIQFQSRFNHKIILTSQSWALEEIINKAASELRRIKIQPWGQDEWKQWFANWAKVQSINVSQNLFTFLKKNKAFSRKSHFLLADLVRQPYYLYLLAVLHRDELLDDEILESATNPQITNTAVVLWKIYQRVNQCFYGYPIRSVSQKILASSINTHIHRTPEAVNSLIKNQHPQELINQMQAVALQILYSRNNKIYLKSDFEHLPAFYFKNIPVSSKYSIFSKQQDAPTTKINSTPSSPSSPSTPSKIEFSHAKFGEYLCAASIVNQLKALTEFTQNAYGEIIFTFDSPLSVAEHLYQLLGYGILTREIEQLIIQGLRNSHSSKFSFQLLCDRLQPFWYSYCGGRWLDEGIAHKAWSYFKQLQNPLNVEQINAAVGINIFLLLSACYKQTKSTFSPCSNTFSLTQSYPQAVAKLIAKTAFFHPDITRLRIGEKSLTFLNLVKADLTQAMLAGINFANTDLSNARLRDACLTGANLAYVNLTGADLTQTTLTNANLTNANLTNANLTGANLLGVNLDLTNLSNACLFQAIIAEAQKEIAIANGAVFSLDKFEELKRLLSYQSQADDTEGEITEIVHNSFNEGEIESAEGEPNMPLELDDDSEDETVLGTTDF
ncbi:MAG: pentapeptide repeat-containing protein, partial [Cyanobacteria bacterium P01_C01_bin.38]